MSARNKYVLAVVILAALAVAAAGLSLRARVPEPKAPGSTNTTFTVARRDFLRSLRLSPLARFT